MTRQQHIEWAKTRALEYLPDQPALAIASIQSDLTKHTETFGEALAFGRRLTVLWINTESVMLVQRAIERLE